LVALILPNKTLLGRHLLLIPVQKHSSNPISINP